jgi:type IV pilus assembly protein PilC
MYDEGMSRVRLHELAVFSRQLATMQAAGLPLVQAVAIIAEQNDNPVFRAILERVARDVKEGRSFAEALAEHPFVFPALFVNMAKSGEVGGNLDVILERLSAHFEAQILFKKKIRHEVVNPVILAAVSGIAGLGLVLATIRAHLGVLTASGKALPWTVGALLSAYNFLHSLAQGAVVAGIAAAVIVLLASFIPPLARLIYEAMIIVPFFGQVWRKIILAKFARLMGTMQISGVPILDSMDIASKLVGHRTYEAAINRARAAIREGEGIAGPLKKAGVFPQMVVQMVSAGEETGKLDEMLLKIADYYDAEVEAALLPARLPGILVVIGLSLLVHGLVLFFVVSPVISAIYSR